MIGIRLNNKEKTLRSQKEILDKIEQFNKTGTDPFRIQRKDLIRKLEWSNACKFLPKYAQDNFEIRENWDKASCLEEDILIKDMRDYMFWAYEQCMSNNLTNCIISCQHYTIWIWLLGPKREKFFQHFLKLFISPRRKFVRSNGVIDRGHYKEIFLKVMEHFGWDPKSFTKREDGEYDHLIEDINSRIILPNDDEGLII